MTTKTALLDSELGQLDSQLAAADSKYQAALAKLAFAPGDGKLHATASTAESEVQSLTAKIDRLKGARTAAQKADREAATLEAQARAREHFDLAGEAHTRRQQHAQRMDELMAELFRESTQLTKATSDLRSHLADTARGIFANDPNEFAYETVVRRLANMHENVGPAFAAQLDRITRAAVIGPDCVVTHFFRNAEDKGRESIAKDTAESASRTIDTLLDAARRRNFPLE
nr:hypothetical protein [uncultured Rhodoferax sp.]